MSERHPRTEQLRQEWLARFEKAIGQLVPEGDAELEQWFKPPTERAAELEREREEVRQIEEAARREPAPAPLSERARISRRLFSLRRKS